MIEVKICGVRRVADAMHAAELGSDYIGLNFFPDSPRYVELDRAAEIAAAVAGRTKTVAVVVGGAGPTIEEIMDEVGPDLLQFHGNEAPADIEPWADRALKAFRVGADASTDLLDGFESAWGYLFDAAHRSLFGGTGETWDWGVVRRIETSKPVFVAGGIGPENVLRAVETSGAGAVDVCSGVESRPGRKDPTLLEHLFRELGR